jgi:hypothetical protein
MWIFRISSTSYSWLLLTTVGSGGESCQQPGMESGSAIDSLMTRKTGWRRQRWQGEVVGSMSNTGFDCKWPKSSMRQLGQWPVGGDVTSIQPDHVTWGKDKCRLMLIVAYLSFAFVRATFASSSP